MGAGGALDPDAPPEEEDFVHTDGYGARGAEDDSHDWNEAAEEENFY
jgi:hypothetical protein